MNRGVGRATRPPAFRHYLSGEDGNVEIESMWTAKKREQLGDVLTVKVKDPALANKQARTGHPEDR
jgi:dsDNA-binding SOS-regulon protein